MEGFSGLLFASILILLGITWIFIAVYVTRGKKPKIRMVDSAQLAEEWRITHPFEAEIVRVMELALKRHLIVLPQNLHAPFDMFVGHDRNHEVLIKCVDEPTKPTPQIYLDRLIVAKDRTRAKKVFLISSGYFSREMRVDAADNGVILISGQDFYKLQQKYPKETPAPQQEHPHARYMRPRNTHAPH